MTAATVRAAHYGAGSFPAADARMADGLEVPRPLRLILVAGWSLAESAGLPVAAYALAAWIYGRDGGLAAGLAAIWLTAVIRKVATGSVPSLLMISAAVLTLQTAVVLATGELWLFLLQFPLANLCMCVLFARTAADRHIPDALQRRYGYARRRRGRRVHLVVPLGPAQARVETPFCLSLSPAASHRLCPLQPQRAPTAMHPELILG